MTAGKFIQCLGLIAFVLFAVLGAFGHYYLGLLVFAGFMVWYFKKGQYLRGVLSASSLEEMEAEASQLETLSRNWLLPNGEAVPMEERQRLTTRRTELLRKIADAKRELR